MFSTSNEKPSEEDIIEQLNDSVLDRALRQNIDPELTIEKLMESNTEMYQGDDCKYIM